MTSTVSNVYANQGKVILLWSLTEERKVLVSWNTWASLFLQQNTILPIYTIFSKNMRHLKRRSHSERKDYIEQETLSSLFSVSLGIQCQSQNNKYKLSHHLHQHHQTGWTVNYCLWAEEHDKKHRSTDLLSVTWLPQWHWTQSLQLSCVWSQGQSCAFAASSSPSKQKT